jgi:hypothetical protein
MAMPPQRGMGRECTFRPSGKSKALTRTATRINKGIRARVINTDSNKVERKIIFTDSFKFSVLSFKQ